MLQTLNESTIHEQILMDLPDAVIWTKPVRDDSGFIIDFEICFANERANDVIAHPSGKLTGLRIKRDGIPSKEMGYQSFQHFLKIYHTGESDGFSFEAATTRTMVYASRRKLGDGVLSFYRDRALQHDVIRKLQDQADLLNGIIQQSPSGLICGAAVRDQNDKIIDFNTVLANKTGADLLDFDLPRLYQLTIRQIHEQREAGAIVELYINVVETGVPLHQELYLSSVDRWFNFSAVKINDGFLVVFTDITDNKRLQNKLEQSVAALRQSNDALNEFAHAASHDLKEPVRKIHFFANRLKGHLKERLEPDEGKMFDRMEHATARMQSLIDDLLDYSQVSYRPSRMENVNLNQKFRDVITDLEVLIQEKKAIVKLCELPVVKGSPRQLQQLFQNLLSNALKYHKPDVPPEVRVEHELIHCNDIPVQKGSPMTSLYFHLLEIRDNGIGFEQKDADRIFDIFQRLHGNTEYKGSGIGLSIARKVAENHGGFVWAISEPGAGASFFVALPAKT